MIGQDISAAPEGSRQGVNYIKLIIYYNSIYILLFAQAWISWDGIYSRISSCEPGEKINDLIHLRPDTLPSQLQLNRNEIVVRESFRRGVGGHFCQTMDI